MKEEKTQGINTETTTKESQNTNKTTKETELLDLRAGYVQHTSPHQNPPVLTGNYKQNLDTGTSTKQSGLGCSSDMKIKSFKHEA